MGGRQGIRAAAGSPGARTSRAHVICLSSARCPSRPRPVPASGPQGWITISSAFDADKPSGGHGGGVVGPTQKNCASTR